MKKKKIAFVSHDASRTGAPILLLRLIQEIKKKATNFEIIILLKSDGALKEDFEQLGKTFVWGPLKNRKKGIKEKILSRLDFMLSRKNIAFLKEFNSVDIVFNNTITNASLLKEIPLNGKKVFSYFHELKVVSEIYATKDDVNFLKNISDKIFVPSLAVKKFLNNEYLIPEEKVLFLNYIIPSKNNVSDKTLLRPSIEYAIPEDKFLVGLCGTLHWRKGYEFLPLIARKIVHIDKIADIHFLWIGAIKESFEYKILKDDLQKLELESYFTFIQPLQDITPYLLKINILALPSREDAFPLVVLEAAALEVPSICFANAGGVPEFIGDNAGLIVDYLDVDGMAKAIIKLKNDSNLRRSFGICAKTKVNEYIYKDDTVNALIELFNK